MAASGVFAIRRDSITPSPHKDYGSFGFVMSDELIAGGQFFTINKGIPLRFRVGISDFMVAECLIMSKNRVQSICGNLRKRGVCVESQGTVAI